MQFDGVSVSSVWAPRASADRGHYAASIAELPWRSQRKIRSAVCADPFRAGRLPNRQCSRVGGGSPCGAGKVTFAVGCARCKKHVKVVAGCTASMVKHRRGVRKWRAGEHRKWRRGFGHADIIPRTLRTPFAGCTRCQEGTCRT